MKNTYFDLHTKTFCNNLFPNCFRPLDGFFHGVFSLGMSRIKIVRNSNWCLLIFFWNPKPLTNGFRFPFTKFRCERNCRNNWGWTLQYFYHNSNSIAINDCSHNKSHAFISYFLLSGFQQSMPCIHKIWLKRSHRFSIQNQYKILVHYLTTLHSRFSNQNNRQWLFKRRINNKLRNVADKRRSIQRMKKEKKKNPKEFSTFVLNLAIFIFFYFYCPFKCTLMVKHKTTDAKNAIA